LITAPIGIFDSGIGGLTIAKAIRKRLPAESFIYFGDTAHMPYGEKSPQTIREFSSGIAHHLLNSQCKAIVIACNSASATAFEEVRTLCGESVPVINVIDPVIDYIGNFSGIHKIGVIGTRATINSGIYAQKLTEKYPELTIESLATPLFAQMVEEGFYDNSVSREVIRAYLKNDAFREIEALILGCTHYPLLQNDLKDFFWDKVQIIDSPMVVAEELANVILSKGLQSQNQNKTGAFECQVSYLTPTFQKIANTIFGESVELKELDIWKI